MNPVATDAPGDNAIDLAGVTKAAFTGLTDTPTPVVTVYGRDGNDTIVGTEVSDTTEGGIGNDRLVAAKGALDTMNGQEGDDTLVWNNGEGTTHERRRGHRPIESNGSDAGADRQRGLHGDAAPAASSSRAPRPARST